MKIRSIGELEDYLDKELAWRKREITTLHFSIQRSRAHQKMVYLRSAIVLLYASWEGFAKKSCEAYLAYVMYQGLTFDRLAVNFLVLGIEKEFDGEIPLRSFSGKYRIAEFLFRCGEGKKLNVDTDKTIDTKSNLNYRTLKEILCKIGIDYSPYELKEQLIDKKLLKFRNMIAHGERDYNERELCDAYDELRDEVLNFLETLKNQIVDAAVNEKYSASA